MGGVEWITAEDVAEDVTESDTEDVEETVAGDDKEGVIEDVEEGIGSVKAGGEELAEELDLVEVSWAIAALLVGLFSVIIILPDVIQFRLRRLSKVQIVFNFIGGRQECGSLPRGFLDFHPTRLSPGTKSSIPREEGVVLTVGSRFV